MDAANIALVNACRDIIEVVSVEQASLLVIAEDQERDRLRETIYDLSQASALLQRVVQR